MPICVVQCRSFFAGTGWNWSEELPLRQGASEWSSEARERIDYGMRASATSRVSNGKVAKMCQLRQ
jgi:hypothetical protein